ncbi:UNVERIFIED_CONTAM: hypothetical protein Sangu_2635600 [Sesamum angustifolium]|uniref:Uncharacterized protein n=1 Tax=Sesamum angustifolium TaxID=2727405 RepID=A0AAW2J2Y6_9LAMI
MARPKTRLEELSTKDEILWKQRAKALWLNKGDKNTTFFHAKANERKLRKEVKALRDETGTLISNRYESYQINSAMLFPRNIPVHTTPKLCDT